MNKFTKEFKQKAIKLKKEGKHPNDIFKDEGIDISDKQKDYALKLINRWKNKKPKQTRFTKEELKTLKKAKKFEEKKKIEFLKAQVAYLKAENDFLVNLPKKKKN